MRKLLKIEPLNSGLHPGLRPELAPLWSTGYNVTFRDGAVKCVDGTSPEAFETIDGGTFTERIRGLAQVFEGDQSRILFAGASTLYGWNINGNGYHIGEGYTSGDWVFDTWGAWIIGTNGIDAPIIWKPNTPVTLIPKFPREWCKQLIRFGPHVLAFNTNEDPTEFIWCSEDNLGEWEATPENSAGQLSIRDAESGIVAVCRLGDSIAVYGKDSLAIVNYIGSPFYFNVRVALNSIGAVSRNSVVTVGRMNYGLGRQGIFVTDGVQAEYIDEPSVRTWLQERVNWDQISKLCAYNNESQQEVIWHFPIDGAVEPNAGISFNYKHKVWSILSYGRTAALERRVLSTPLVTYDTIGFTGEPLHLFGYVGVGILNGLQPLTAQIQTKPIDFGESKYRKIIEAVKLNYTGTLQLELGCQDNLEDEIDWQPAATAEEWNYCFLDCNYLSLRLTGAAPWTLSGLEIYGTPAGEHGNA